MGNALYINWGDAQKLTFGLQTWSSTFISITFGTVITQYCVSDWIWNSKMKDHHKTPAFIVSMLMFWTIWTLLFNFVLLMPSGGDMKGYYIAIPILAFGGFLVNLAFTWIWNYSQNRGMSNEGGILPESPMSTYTSPLIENETVDTLLEDIEEVSTYVKTPPPAKVTVDYINNIKIFLTNVVIVHHCATDFDTFPGLCNMTQNPDNWGSTILKLFTAINSSYFMSLFFFYSGFFVPKSFDKKSSYVSLHLIAFISTSSRPIIIHILCRL